MLGRACPAKAVFSGECTARLLEGWCAARCVAGGAVYRLARLAAARAALGRSLPCLFLAGYCTRFGDTAPKTTKTPRTLWGKSSLEITAARREKKQPAPPLKDRTCAQVKGAQQGAPMMEKSLGNVAQVPAMFKQIGKTKRPPPQKELYNDRAGPLEDNGNLTLCTRKVARGTDSLD
ncbi:hypothetical protein NDU88_001637 [Pleurodeles waltl]|uniref:Uncharacterized protein n=1 Tax=Pleurodeles waltl TaxID=8319 RepID=A0AAV7W0U7_PLEWA|nr:hypothetical protein NDU88_001637 [Pleurodeles waltl]